jgi:thiamine kinase-like enzyme
MKREIELFSKIGHHEFAPSLKNRNIDEGWYEEEFVEGLSGYGLVPKGSSEIIMDRYFSLIEPLLEKMILADSPEPVFALSYLETVENSPRIGRTGANDEEVLEPHAFIHETASRCRDFIGETRPKIYLVFCHGDFHQFNMFRAGGAVKLIDWEAAQRLSLLFDFFNFFFSQMYLQNTSLDCPEELKKGIKQMASRLSAKAPQLAENLVECAELYRLVYYIERIHTFLGSFGLDSLRISRWIEAFREFEGKVGDRRIGLRPS